jgi:hypothetical protein
MTKNVINFLKKMFLWTKVMDKRLVYSMIKEHLPVDNVRVLDNSNKVILDFGEYNNQKLSLLLEFVWENNRLIDIRNCN